MKSISKIVSGFSILGVLLISSLPGAPLAVSGKEESEIHHTVAELMILANSTVAERTRRVFPSAALLRVHSPPDPSRLTAFESVAAKVGVQSVAVGLETRRRDKGERRVRTKDRRFWERSFVASCCVKRMCAIVLVCAEGGGGGYSFLACLRRMTVDHASLARGEGAKGILKLNSVVLVKGSSEHGNEAGLPT